MEEVQESRTAAVEGAQETQIILMEGVEESLSAAIGEITSVAVEGNAPGTVEDTMSVAVEGTSAAVEDTSAASTGETQQTPASAVQEVQETQALGNDNSDNVLPNTPPPPYNGQRQVAGTATTSAATTSVRAKATPAKKLDMAPFVERFRTLEERARAEFARWEAMDSKTLTMDSVNTPAKRKASEMDFDDDFDITDDEDDDDPDNIAPYVPSKQQRPKLPIYHPGFKLTEDLANGILKTILDFLKASQDNGYKDLEINTLWNDTIKTRIPESGAAIRIAITGDTGSGKSATVNSLLGVDNLTPEGDSGGAVTNVVTEFRKKLSNQKQPITAVVVFFCLEMCEKLVKDWVTVWHAVENKEEEDIDENERNEHDAAFECLEALYAERITSNLSFTQFLASANQAKVLEKFLRWTRTIHRNFINDGEDSLELGAATHSDMREQLRPFRGTAQNARYGNQKLSHSPWPFVEVIRYHLENAILEQDIFLADVPGTRDINKFRVKTANEYLQTCDMTVIVGEIKRVCSDSAFRQHYMDAHRRRYHGSVILIATKSDEMNDDGGSNLVLDSEAEEDFVPIEEQIDAANSEYESIDKAIDSIREDIRSVKGKRTQLFDDGQDDSAARKNRFQELSQKLKGLKTKKNALPLRIASLEKQRKELRITCRNRQVAKELDRNYQNDTKDDRGATIFCLSNRMFMRHLRGYNRKNVEKIPSMKLEDTQILAACEHLYRLPSQGKLAVLDHFVSFTIPAHLDVVQMSCSKSTEARIVHVIKIIDGAIKIVDREIKALADEYKKTYLKVLVDAIGDHNLQSKFDDNATKKFARWGQNVQGATHRAIVRKHGDYVQKKKGGVKVVHNWNEDLMATVRPIIDTAFREVLDKACPAFQADGAQKIKKAFNELNKQLKNDPQALAGDAYALCVGRRFAEHEKNITVQISNATKKFRNQINDLRSMAMNTEQGDYFYEATIDIYEEALKLKPEKGKTQVAVRNTYLAKKFTGSQGVFTCFSCWAQEDTDNLIDEITGDLRNGIVKVFLQIKNSFERQKTRKENDSEEGKQFRKNLHLLVNESKRLIDGVVKESLEKCSEHK